MTLAMRLRVSPSTFDMFLQWERLTPARIVEGGRRIRPGVRGSIVTIQRANASIATVVRIAQRQEAAKAGLGSSTCFS